jgi:hypothetical protein
MRVRTPSAGTKKYCSIARLAWCASSANLQTHKTRARTHAHMIEHEHPDTCTYTHGRTRTHKHEFLPGEYIVLHKPIHTHKPTTRARAHTHTHKRTLTQTPTHTSARVRRGALHTRTRTYTGARTHLPHQPIGPRQVIEERSEEVVARLHLCRAEAKPSVSVEGSSAAAWKPSIAESKAWYLGTPRGV